MPVINIKKEKAEDKELKSKKKIKEEKEAAKSKKLPFYSKEKIYERELKIVAVEESKITSRKVLEQVQFPYRRREGEEESRTEDKNDEQEA